MSPPRRSRRSLWLFALCAGLVLLAQGGVTWVLLDLEQRERAARTAAQTEQRVSEALSRMDWALLPLIAGEAARWQPSRTPHVAAAPFFQLYFELGAGEQLVSPQTGASAAALAPAATRHAGDALAQLPRMVAPAELWARLRTSANPPDWRQVAAGIPQAQQDAVAGQGMSQQKEDPGQVQNYLNRAQGLGNVGDNAFDTNAVLFGPTREPGAFLATFVRARDGSDQLFFLRQVAQSKQPRLQGIWADWHALRTWLLSQVSDLFPHAALAAAYEPGFTRRLVSVPAVVEPGALGAAVALPEVPARNSVHLTLAVTWASVLGALLVVGFALRAATDLSERRGLFVSAVTHELRTPLTTFRMYSQMLADGMVPGPTERQEYLETLKSESERLTRVVESVLLYARLEDGRQSAHRRTVPAAELLEQVAGTLRRRAQEAKRELVVELAVPAAARVHVDQNAVEQILLNLLDNAIKYAPEGELLLRARCGPHDVTVEFRDHGPGIPPEEAQAVFEPFTRGRRENAGPTPGLGLGLALARGLARAMGGSLRLRADRQPGAVFELLLPLLR